MEFGAIDDHAGLPVIGHFLQGEGIADHIAGEALSAFGIMSPNMDAVMDREAGMSPLSHALGELWVEAGMLTEEVQDPVTQSFNQCGFGDGRQDAESAGRVEHAIGDQGVHMWIERDQFAEGLNIENKGGLSSTGHRNTSLKFICGRTEIQSFPGPLVQAQCYLVQL